MVDFLDVERQYDVGVVLCGGLREVGGQYFPTTHEDEDEFGMLFGEARVWAAAELYNRGLVKELMTIGGISEKQKEKFWPNIPPQEGDVYAQAISDYAADLRGEKPNKNERIVDVVGNAQNTWSELLSALTVIDEKYEGQPVDVAVISNMYHTMLRVPALVAKMQTKGIAPTAPNVRCLPAENMLHAFNAEKYDWTLYEAYRGGRALERYMNESAGFWDLQLEQYHHQEFQNSDRAPLSDPTQV
jgi:hypothetical protein